MSTTASPTNDQASDNKAKSECSIRPNKYHVDRVLEGTSIEIMPISLLQVFSPGVHNQYQWNYEQNKCATQSTRVCDNNLGLSEK